MILAFSIIDQTLKILYFSSFSAVLIIICIYLWAILNRASYPRTYFTFEVRLIARLIYGSHIYSSRYQLINLAPAGATKVDPNNELHLTDKVNFLEPRTPGFRDLEVPGTISPPSFYLIMLEVLAVPPVIIIIMKCSLLFALKATTIQKEHLHIKWK